MSAVQILMYSVPQQPVLFILFLIQVFTRISCFIFNIVLTYFLLLLYTFAFHLSLSILRCGDRYFVALSVLVGQKYISVLRQQDGDKSFSHSSCKEIQVTGPFGSGWNNIVVTTAASSGHQVL